MFAPLQKKEDKRNNPFLKDSFSMNSNSTEKDTSATYKPPTRQIYATSPSEELMSKSNVTQRYKMDYNKVDSPNDSDYQFQQSPSPKQETKNNGEVIQRFKIVDSGKYTQEQDKGEKARKPFTRYEEDISVLDKGKNKAMESGWKHHLDKLPPLKVANDNTLAINSLKGEPKEFYATTDVISNANKDLSAVGSPIELIAAGNKITLPDKNKTELVMVQPKIKGKEPAGVDDFVSLTYHICRDTAKEIIGGEITHLLLKGKEGMEKETFNSTDGTIVTGPHSLAEKLSKGGVSTEEAKEAIGGEKKDMAPKVGKEYGKASREGGKAKNSTKELGINENAWAKVGQAYITQSIFDESGSKKDYAKSDEPTNAFVWGYHFSAVIAESLEKEYQIAMENYNRDSDIKASKTELLNELKSKFKDKIKGLELKGDEVAQIGKISEYINKNIEVSEKEARAAYGRMWKANNGSVNAHWYFRMIGQGKNESFHEQMASSPYFVNPMTLAVGNLATGESYVSFDEGTSTINNVIENGLKKIIQRILASIHQGFTPKKIRIIGHGNGWKGTGIGAGKMGDARAQAIYNYLKDKKIPTNILQIDKSPGRLDKSNESVNRRVRILVEE